VLKHLAGWIVPHRLWLKAAEWKRAGSAAPDPASPLIAANARLAGIHRGERCFILGNGPSVNCQDLRPLKHQTVISVSSGYHHPRFLEIDPQYHCVPQLTYTTLGEEGAVAWFREMHGKLGRAELFLSTQEAPLVQRAGLFPGRKVNYVQLGGRAAQADDGIYDLAQPVPGVQTVPLMCLMIAMYMGFAEIVLLGIEHDSFRTRRYEYFYAPTVLKGMDTTVNEKGEVKESVLDELKAYVRLFEQYAHLQRIALRAGVRILNATDGGALEEFPRVKFETLF